MGRHIGTGEAIKHPVSDRVKPGEKVKTDDGRAYINAEVFNKLLLLVVSQ